MNRKTLFNLGVLVIVASMLLSACASAATTVAPTQKAVEPTATSEPKYEPLKVEAPDCEYGGLFKSIEAVDEYTVKFIMCVPDPAFPSKAAFTSFAIQPKEYLEKTGGAPLEKPIGTGPYMISEWKRGDELVFKRFDGYWGEKAKVPSQPWFSVGVLKQLSVCLNCNLEPLMPSITSVQTISPRCAKMPTYS